MEKRKIKKVDPSKISDEGIFCKLTAAQHREKLEVLSIPIEPIDLESLKGIDSLVTSFRGASIQARRIGECAEIWEKAVTDPDRPTVLLGLAGPLIAAGLRKVIRDLIKYNLIDVIVTTGAIMYQDYYQSRGYLHYVGNPDADDAQLRDLYIDRIYDTYVDETKFWESDCSVASFADTLAPGKYSSRKFLEALGGSISDDQSILATAKKHGVPIFAPAINDSSIGIGLTEHYHRCYKEGRPGVTIDSIQDNYELTQIVVKSKATSAVYIAGGVPKNYINDSVVMSYIFNRDTGGHRYAIQLTTDVPHWGGLSGSTLSEARSWGKVSKVASHQMAFVEPSVSLPLVAGYLVNKNAAKNRSRILLDWDPPILNSVKFK